MHNWKNVSKTVPLIVENKNIHNTIFLFVFSSHFPYLFPLSLFVVLFSVASQLCPDASLWPACASTPIAVARPACTFAPLCLRQVRRVAISSPLPATGVASYRRLLLPWAAPHKGQQWEMRSHNEPILFLLIPLLVPLIGDSLFPHPSLFLVPRKEPIMLPGFQLLPWLIDSTVGTWTFRFVPFTSYCQIRF